MYSSWRSVLVMMWIFFSPVIVQANRRTQNDLTDGQRHTNYFIRNFTFSVTCWSAALPDSVGYQWRFEKDVKVTEKTEWDFDNETINSNTLRGTAPTEVLRHIVTIYCEFGNPSRVMNITNLVFTGPEEPTYKGNSLQIVYTTDKLTNLTCNSRAESAESGYNWTQSLSVPSSVLSGQNTTSNTLSLKVETNGSNRLETFTCQKLEYFKTIHLFIMKHPIAEIGSDVFLSQICPFSENQKTVFRCDGVFWNSIQHYAWFKLGEKANIPVNSSTSRLGLDHYELGDKYRCKATDDGSKWKRLVEFQGSKGTQFQRESYFCELSKSDDQETSHQGMLEPSSRTGEQDTFTSESEACDTTGLVACLVVMGITNAILLSSVVVLLVFYKKYKNLYSTRIYKRKNGSMREMMIPEGRVNQPSHGPRTLRCRATCMFIVFVFVLLTDANGARNDKRWVTLPESKIELLNGRISYLHWAFHPPINDRVFDVTIIQDTGARHGMSVATSMINTRKTEPVDMKIYYDFRNRVTAKYFQGNVSMASKWTLNDSGEIFIQVDLPPTPLTASTYITVYEGPKWVSDVPENITIPVSRHRDLRFVRNNNPRSPNAQNFTLGYIPRGGKSSNQASLLPRDIITIFPTKNGNVIKYSDPSMSGVLHLSANPLLVDVRLHILNMTQSLAGRYVVRFNFNITNCSLQDSFDIIHEQETDGHRHTNYFIRNFRFSVTCWSAALPESLGYHWRFEKDVKVTEKTEWDFDNETINSNTLRGTAPTEVMKHIVTIYCEFGNPRRIMNITNLVFTDPKEPTYEGSSPQIVYTTDTFTQLTCDSRAKPDESGYSWTQGLSVPIDDTWTSESMQLLTQNITSNTLNVEINGSNRLETFTCQKLEYFKTIHLFVMKNSIAKIGSDIFLSQICPVSENQKPVFRCDGVFWNRIQHYRWFKISDNATIPVNSSTSRLGLDHYKLGDIYRCKASDDGTNWKPLVEFQASKGTQFQRESYFCELSKSDDQETSHQRILQSSPITGKQESEACVTTGLVAGLVVMGITNAILLSSVVFLLVFYKIHKKPRINKRKNDESIIEMITQTTQQSCHQSETLSLNDGLQ